MNSDRVLRSQAGATGENAQNQRTSSIPRLQTQPPSNSTVIISDLNDENNTTGNTTAVIPNTSPISNQAQPLQNNTSSSASPQLSPPTNTNATNADPMDQVRYLRA